MTCTIKRMPFMFPFIDIAEITETIDEERGWIKRYRISAFLLPPINQIETHNYCDVTGRWLSSADQSLAADLYEMFSGLDDTYEAMKLLPQIKKIRNNKPELVSLVEQTVKDCRQEIAEEMRLR